MPAPRTAEASAELRASLLDHARRLIRREGPDALTMRALAAEAGCAVGQPYTVFASREDLVAELVRLELSRLREQLDTWVGEAGRRSVAENLARYAAILLDADVPALVLARTLHDAELDASVAGSAHDTGLVHSFDSAVADYLAAEQRLGRVASGVDVQAFGFLITGAIHNLVEAGPAYPRPARRRLRRYLAAVAERLAPSPDDVDRGTDRPPPRKASSREDAP